MKRILNILIFSITSIFMFILVSCKGNVNVTGEMTLKATATTISVTAKVNDPDSKVNSSSVRASYQTVDEDGDLGSTSYVSFSDIPSTDTDGNLKSETEVIKDLKMNQTYRIKLYVTIGSDVHYLAEEDITTTTEGTSEETAIKITSKEEFLNIVNDTDAYYSLENDIDLESDAQSPLFNSSTSFSGTILGNNHKITGFKQTAGAQYEGLFGYLSSDATIKDLIIESPTVEVSRSGSSSFGVLAGYNDGKIINCKVTDATVKYTLSSTSTSALQHAGGLVGENDTNGSISNSSFTGSVEVSLKSRVNYGALCGYNMGTISNSFANATSKVDLTSTSTSAEVLAYNASGFVGSNNGVIVNSYSEGSLTGVYSISSSNTARDKYLAVNIGGFAGQINSGSIQNCVANVSIGYTSYTAAISNIGLFAGITSTSYTSYRFVGQNSVILTDKTYTLDLLEKDSDWKIKVAKEEEDETTESSSSDTIEIDRQLHFGFTNFLKKEDGSNTDFENQFNEHKSYYIAGSITPTIDEVSENISEIPYTVVVPESGMDYTEFNNLSDFIRNYLETTLSIK